jgi:hypothetical protein
LLGISWNYLQKHPAEKEAIGSGFTIMFDKVELRFNGLTGKGEASVVRYKQQLQDRYDDMILATSYIDECKDTDEINAMKSIRAKLEDQDLDNFEQELTAHYADYIQLQQFVNSGCVIE